MIMFVEVCRDIIKERIRIAVETQDEWDYGIEQCQKKITELFANNMSDALRFLDIECTADEFSWLSEVFEDIAEKTQSGDFIAALRRLAEKYPEETQSYNVISFIDSAEGCIHP